MKKSINIETQIRSMTKILDDLRQGIIQIPPFQREFVWERNNIRELFDSIRNNYPIGSILIWKPRERKEWPSKPIGSYMLPDCKGQQIYVLDGYQRLSSLFGCLTNPEKSGLDYDSKLRADYFDLYYDLDDESFIYMGGRLPKPSQVPVYVLMSTMDFRRYARRMMDHNIPERLLEKYLDRADSFSRSLVDYKIAVIEVTNAELDDAVDIFSRINSKGTDISPDWMVNALAYNDDFSFAVEIDNLKSLLKPYNFDGISRTALFRCYQSAFDDKMYIDQSNIERLARREDFSKVVQATTPLIEKSVRFLYHDLNVVDYKLLPYNTQLIFLMTFFKKLSSPSKKQLMDLKHWFWVTSYSNYFTIYSLSSQRKAFAHFNDYLAGKTPDIVYIEGDKQSFKTLSLPERLSLSSVRCRSLLLFELQHYRAKTKLSSPKGGLSLKKIFMNKEACPANIIPYFGSDRKMKWNIGDSLLYTNDSETFYESYFLPKSSLGQGDKSFLQKRMSLIVKNEKTFVESFGMIYGE